jgi:hypothetical protein
MYLSLSSFLQDEHDVISLQGLDIPMKLNEEDGHWRVTIDLADGKIHFILFLCVFI